MPPPSYLDVRRCTVVVQKQFVKVNIDAVTGVCLQQPATADVTWVDVWVQRALDEPTASHWYSDRLARAYTCDESDHLFQRIFF